MSCLENDHSALNSVGKGSNMQNIDAHDNILHHLHFHCLYLSNPVTSEILLGVQSYLGNKTLCNKMHHSLG